MADWIKCSERMPDEDWPVWLWGAYEENRENLQWGFEGYRLGEKFFAYNNGLTSHMQQWERDMGYDQDFEASNVTHWQPLPEPPQE